MQNWRKQVQGVPNGRLEPLLDGPQLWNPRCIESVCLRELMLKRINSILLFVVLAGGNAVTAASLCADSSNQKVGRSPHCKMARTTTATPMGCCQNVPVPHSEHTSKEAAGCCEMSAPLPNRPRPALPGNASEEFRFQTQAQLLDSSEPVSLSALTPLPLGWVSSTIAFCLDRSDTYLLASTFRI